MQKKIRTADAEMTEEKASCRIAAIDGVKFAINQPADARRLVVSQDTSGRDLLELLFQSRREGNRNERLANRHLAVGMGDIAGDGRIVDAKRADVDRARIMGAHAAAQHVNAGGGVVFRVDAAGLTGATNASV